ncbi:hypothetical protein IOCL2690_000466000 [Leishmania lindenbergi]|uniref:Uncharacterized protein n=1 Tax=Leishmania lindenbergi TaxID=651832 RepID=A0AAW3AEL8_9TRYP
MFYSPLPTYYFGYDDQGDAQARRQTREQAPWLDDERIEHVWQQRRLSCTVPNNRVGDILHGIALSHSQAPNGARDNGERVTPSFAHIFIPSESAVQVYHIHSGSVVFGRKIHVGDSPLSSAGRTLFRVVSFARIVACLATSASYHFNGENIGECTAYYYPCA